MLGHFLNDRTLTKQLFTEGAHISPALDRFDHCFTFFIPVVDSSIILTVILYWVKGRLGIALIN